MAGYFWMGMLAAFGLLSILWAALGWLLPGGEGCVLVCRGEPDVGILSRYRWLRDWGLLRCPLLVLSDKDCGPERLDGLEAVSPENLVFRLQEEWNRKDGTGNGDPSGRGERRGISEL